MLHYYKKYISAPIAGTDETVLIVSEEEVEIDYDEEKQNLFDAYGYLINGWGYDDPTEEEEENFKEDCEIDFEEIDRAEFDELVEEGYEIEEV